MKVLITGGTGFLGSALCRSLSALGHAVTVLSRHPETVEGVQAIASFAQLGASDSFDVIINLAGAPIVDARWTDARKQVIRDSRIALTQQLVASIAKMSVKPQLLISGSAIGYYGDHGDKPLTEQSESGNDFSAQLCQDWEAAALQVEQYGVRVCLIRTGLVIGAGGGFLQRMLLPFRIGLGGRLGDGQQWMSWIHIHDWLAIVLLMISDASLQGAYNATAPNPVTNNGFTKTLAKILKRPAILPVPAWLLKPLLGEMSALLLGSQRVLPECLLAQGFNFQYTDLETALQDVLGHP
ncbi:MAG: TIGR01777 family oxidoreductase [Methylococcales bacterium]|nr:TIGR01777 family oxidoreductase [Methylococcales bacterium]